MRKNLTIASVLIGIWGIVCVAVYFVGRHHGEKRAISDLLPQVDTLYICDTVTQYEPIEIERRVVERDTVLLSVFDTIRKTDSVFVTVPREQRVYQDTMYRAVVSGFMPRLDSISIYRKTELIYVPEMEYRTRRWSFGIQGGAGVVSPFGGNPTAGWYVGLGVSYNLW